MFLIVRGSMEVLTVFAILIYAPYAPACREVRESVLTHAVSFAQSVAASAIVYFSKGKLDWNMFFPVGIGVLAGGGIGAWLLGKITAKWITRIFALVMLAAGVKLFF